MPREIESNLPVAREHAHWGTGDKAWCHVAVTESGAVLAYDHVAGHYSRHHALPEADRRRARGMAEGVRQGTHYTAAGFVLRKATA